MSAVSIASIAVSTQKRGYSTEKTSDSTRGIQFQGDCGWGVAGRDYSEKKSKSRGLYHR